MKRIEAIIKPAAVADVCEVLRGAGHSDVTITSVEGRDSEHGWTHHVRGMIYTDTVLTRSRVEIVVSDSDVTAVVRVIQKAAMTGEQGGGTIYIHDIAEVIRIRTNESGIAAL